MELRYNRIALPEPGSTKELMDVIRRDNAGDCWYVPFAPIRFDEQNDWRYYKREMHVAIPMFPYLVPNNPTDALGFAFQLGARAISELHGKSVRVLHLSLGEPTNQIVDPNDNSVSWQFYLGIGALLD